MAKLARKFHKWLMAFLSIQFLIWSVTGAYMVYLNIHYIHGDSLVNNQQDKVEAEKINITLSALYARYGELTQLSVGRLADKTVYRFKVKDNQYLIDTSTGQQLAPLSENDALLIATNEYSGKGKVSTVSFIADNPPFELSRRHLPVWRIDFADVFAPALYISANTGQVVTKRHDLWRLFDWMFRFHVMDYQDSEVDNVLLLIFTLSGLSAAIAGLILTYSRLIRKPLLKVKTASLSKSMEQKR